ncbi:MAG TPA: L,D-transpeptidase family protein [Methylococcaceae bacterium]|nr:L,D-transpeptidase family protein [Methylococcaceae bacterium]
MTEPAPAATHEIPSLEKHRFSIAKDEGVVGSLGTIQLRDGDTLPDVARHFGLGYEEIVAANIELDPWVPRADGTVLIPLQFVLPQAPRRGIVINLAALRLFYFPAKGNGAQVVTYPVGIGREGKSTPTGNMWIARKMRNPTWYPTKNILEDHLRRGDPLPAAVPPGPDNPLGQYAMYLSRPMYLMHGTNKPYSVGLRASNGCIRLYPENADLLYKGVALKEAVHIVNQPYLVGRRGGVLYLQAYRSHEELNEKALKKTLRADLKKWEREQNQPLDWDKIERILEEGRGIPLPISKGTPPADAVLLRAQPIARPNKWFGQPESPPEAADGWHVSAADTASEISARRIAAILNHQGPPIPAHAVLNGERYQVIAGPFADAKAAKAVMTRLKADMELEGRIIAPESELATISPAEPAASKPTVPEAIPSERTATDATISEEMKPESASSAVSGSGVDDPESMLSTDDPTEATPHESTNSNATSPEWRMPEIRSPKILGPNPLEFPPEMETPDTVPASMEQAR